MVAKKKIIVRIMYIGLTVVITVGIKLLDVSVNARQASYENKISECQSVINLMDSEASTLRKQNRRLYTNRKSLKKCQFIHSHQVKWSGILETIIHNLPQNVWLKKITVIEQKSEAALVKIYTKMNFQKQDQYAVVIHGRSVTSESADLFAEMLEKNKLFKNIRVKENRHIDFAWQFRIECKLDQW